MLSQGSERLWWSNSGAGGDGWVGGMSLMGLLWAQAVLACFRLLCACLVASASEQLRLVFPLVF